MLAKGQEINEVDAGKGWTPLHYAVNYGQKHLVEYLIIKGADVYRKDFLGKNNPIDVLSNINRGEIVKILNTRYNLYTEQCKQFNMGMYRMQTTPKERNAINLLLDKYDL